MDGLFADIINIGMGSNYIGQDKLGNSIVNTPFNYSFIATKHHLPDHIEQGHHIIPIIASNFLIIDRHRYLRVSYIDFIGYLGLDYKKIIESYCCYITSLLYSCIAYKYPSGFYLYKFQSS